MNYEMQTSNWSTDTKELYEQLQKLYKHIQGLLQVPNKAKQKKYEKLLSVIQPDELKKQMEYYFDGAEMDWEEEEEYFILSVIWLMYPTKTIDEIIKIGACF